MLDRNIELGVCGCDLFLVIAILQADEMSPGRIQHGA